jgi:hypothetical protein
MRTSPPMDQFLDDMLASLSRYLQQSSSSLPKPGVSIVSLKERSLAVGNSRGMQSLASFAVFELKGGRLEAVARYQLWGNDLDALETEMAALHGRLLAAKNELWNDGILRFAAEETSPSEHVPDLNAWRKTADYRVLYEYHYNDTDEAGSLITRIPISIDSQYNEATVVSGEMVRWDNTATPALEVHGKISRSLPVRAIFMLAFLPGVWDGSEVTISVNIGGQLQEKNFKNVREFREAFEWVKGENWPEVKTYKTVELGGKTYIPCSLAFPNPHFPYPIVFKGEDDFFRVSYASPPFDDDAVLYLRLSI